MGERASATEETELSLHMGGSKGSGSQDSRPVGGTCQALVAEPGL